MRTALAFCVVLALSACSSDSPVGPNVGPDADSSESSLELGKAIDLEAVGGLLKGRWFHINIDWFSGTAEDIWVLEVRSLAGKSSEFEYDLIRLYDRRYSRSKKIRGEELGGGKFSEYIDWEYIERGKIRPYTSYEAGHIWFDRIYTDPAHIMQTGFVSSNRVVVWDTVLKMIRWEEGDFPLTGRIFTGCIDQPDVDVCQFDYISDSE